MSDIKDLVDKYVADGVMTSQEHDEFMARVHADGQIDAEEQEQISRIFSLISSGQLKIVDEERDAFGDAESRRQEAREAFGVEVPPETDEEAPEAEESDQDSEEEDL